MIKDNRNLSGLSKNVSGLILAGGQGKRMDQQDKGLTLLANRPLIAHVIAAFSPQVDSITISANRNISEYRNYGYEVLEDTISGYTGFSGPLAGLLTGLQRCSLEMINQPMDKRALVVVPCDAPLLPQDLVSRLIECFNSKVNSGTTPLAVIPDDGARLQPLFGLYTMEALPSLKEYLDTGQRKVGNWVASLSPQVVDFSDAPEGFLNVNSSEDLFETEKSLLHS